MISQCEGIVNIDMWHSSRCGNKAKVVVDGKHYCGIHDPIRIQAQDQKRSEKYHRGDCPNCGIHPRLPQYHYCPWCGTKLKGD